MSQILCDACGYRIADNAYATDDEVCGGTDGPGFFLCSRSKCVAMRPLDVDARRAFYTARRACNEQETRDVIWQDDAIQFPRLLAEIDAVIVSDQRRELCQVMDLDAGELRELFDRAERAFGKVKARRRLRIRLPENPIEGLFCERRDDGSIHVLDENRLLVGVIELIGLVYHAFDITGKPVLSANGRTNMFGTLAGAVRAIARHDNEQRAED